MKSRCAVAAAAAFVTLAGGPARAGEVPERFRVKSFADVLDPATMIFLEIPDYARARAAYRATPHWKFWWEGAGREFIARWIRSMEDEEFTAMWRAFAESAKLPGKVAFVLGGPEPADEWGTPMSAFLIEAGDKAAELQKHVKTMWGAGLVEDEGEAVIQGVRFQEADEFLVGSAGGLVIGGFGKAALESLLSRFAERPWENLAASRAFKIAQSRALPDAHFYTFVNYTGLWRTLAEEFDEDWLPVERSGLPQLAATSLSGRFTPEGVVDKLSFVLRGRARGMWELIRPEPLSRKAWGLMPGFTSGFVAMRLPERTEPFIDMLRAVDPDMADEFLAPFEEFREATGINFEKDLLRLTTGEVTAVFLEEDPGRKPAAAAEPDGEFMTMDDIPFFRHMVLLVELRDPAAARATMDRRAAARLDGEPFGRKRRFGRLDGWQEGGQMTGGVCVAGAGGVAFVAFAPEPIERLAEHIAKKGPRLVDSAEFKAATSWIPADAGFAAYSNVRKIMRSLHRFASHEADMMADEPVEMPKLEQLLGGLSPLTACARVDRPGFSIEIHSPDGIWAFWFQLMAHMFWRIDVEPMEERRQERAGGLPPAPALEGVDPEITKAYVELWRRLAEIEDPEIRIALLEDQLARFKGTHYEAMIEQSIMVEREKLLRQAYADLMTKITALKMTTGEKVEILQAALPTFAGTRFEKMIQAMIAREKAPGNRAAAAEAAREEARAAALAAREEALAAMAKRKALEEERRRAAAARAEGAVKVLAVKAAEGLVMVSAGRDAGVQPGAVFVIYRGGTRIARVKVEKAYADMSSAKVVEKFGGAEPRMDDEARPEPAAGGAAPAGRDDEF